MLSDKCTGEIIHIGNDTQEIKMLEIRPAPLSRHEQIKIADGF